MDNFIALPLGVCLRLHSDNTQTALPSWLFQESQVQVADEIRKCSAFIGVQTQRGFSALGSGFLGIMGQDGFEFVYLVTAAHVVWPEHSSNRSNAEPPQGAIDVRFNKQDGSPHIIKTKQSDWIFHSDRHVDLAALPLGFFDAPPPANFDTKIVNIRGMAVTPERIEKFGISLGDEIFIVGAFVGRVGERKNIPIIRVGNIAAMPEEPIAFGSPKKAAYLIETRSLGGISGSPVFVNLQPTRINQTPRAAKIPDPVDATRQQEVLPYALLGIVLGAHSGQYSDDFVSEGDTDIKVPKDADFNAGISVVLPIQEALDFLESEKVMGQRTEDIEARRQQSGYRPTSARRTASPKKKAASETDNPSAKEDFMSLLNAAARSNKPVS